MTAQGATGPAMSAEGGTGPGMLAQGGTVLACPEPGCGKTGFADNRGLAAHARSHQTVTCPECGTVVGALGIGSHRRNAHGVAGATRPGKARTDEAVAVHLEALHALLPGTDAPLLERLAKFVVASPVPDGLVLAGLTYGPVMVYPRNAGHLAARAGEPVVIVSLEALAAYQASAVASAP